jgi:hypothetical protein
MLNGETVANVLIGKHASGQIAHDLMHVHQNLPGILRMEGNWLDMSIDLAPLLRPVGADFFRPTDKTASSGVMRARAASMSRALKAAYAARSNSICGAG